MNPVCKLVFVKIAFHIICTKTFVPWESQKSVLTFEVIFDMALSTNKRAHLLVCDIFNIPALSCKGLCKGRPRYSEVHCFRIVAVLATDWIDYLASHAAPRRLIELPNTNLIHYPWHIRAFACPAGSRLGLYRPQCIVNIRNRVIVSPSLFIVPCKCITCPHDYQFRVFFQIIDCCCPCMVTCKCGIKRHPVRFILPGEVLSPHLIPWLPVRYRF